MFFERAKGGEKAVLVHVDFTSSQEREDIDEFIELANSAGAEIVRVIRVTRTAPSAKTYIGSGKLEEIEAVVNAEEADIVLFNNILTPSQERNLERVLKCRVVDRTGLILDIFAQRARTHEGKLQVELAQLQHMSTRLVRGWTHLERQKGGIGLRGPGETQLETDRRLLRERIKSIQRRLEKVQKQREQGRRGRKRAAVPTVSIVGYTNAGKSTLFNYITDADVYAADQLFATLDPTLRRVDVPDLGPIVLADTVGFIRHLPHKLVEAFKATLEETVEADLLLHVVDCAAQEREDNMLQVNEVLREIGADNKPQLFVFNKLDLLAGVAPHIDYDDQGVPLRVWVSARQGLGIDLLLQAIAARIAEKRWKGCICLPPRLAQLRAQLFALQVVESEQFGEQGESLLTVNMLEADKNRLEKQFAIDWQALITPV